MGGPGSGGKIGKRGPYKKTEGKRAAKSARKDEKKAASTESWYETKRKEQERRKCGPCYPYLMTKGIEVNVEKPRRSERVAEETAASAKTAAASLAAADPPKKVGPLDAFLKKPQA